MAHLELRGVTKSYGTIEIIHGVDLEVKDGEFVVFVGPSGCGKSTLLRMIAGLEDISGGDVKIDGAVVNKIPASERGLAMVFQSYALYPHMSVYKNMAFGLENMGLPKPEIEKRVSNAASLLRLTDYLQRKPKALSGGQRLRLALQVVGQAQQRRCVADALLDLGLRQAHVFEAERHVLVDAHMRIERVGLEHHGETALGRRYLVDHGAVDLDVAAGNILQP